MNTEFRGKLVYAGKGRLGVITKYFYEEGPTGEPTEKWVIRITKTKNEVETSTKPTFVQGVRYAYGEKTLFVEIKIKNQFYPGYAILSPSDTKDNAFGKRLAIARAMGDGEGIADLLDEDFNATYVEEYGEGDETVDETDNDSEADEVESDEDNPFDESEAI